MKLCILLTCILAIMTVKSSALFSTDRQKEMYINIALSDQTLYVIDNDTVVRQYPISSSKFGIGNKAGSNKTPLGKHRIRDKIGEGAPLNTIFRNRGNTGKIAEINRSSEPGGKDLITSRILWLEGLEDGINRGKGIDSYKRYIYIHGTADEGAIGAPSSHGCIRMKNTDVVELFELVSTGTDVYIIE